MLLATLQNSEIKIQPDQAEEYAALGYTIYEMIDGKPKLKMAAKNAVVSQTEYDKVVAELEKLKAAAEVEKPAKK